MSPYERFGLFNYVYILTQIFKIAHSKKSPILAQLKEIIHSYITS
jgi:hypothetical protein